MSPEQVRGEPADSRSDIFAFGAVLYEMVTGKQAFAAPTAAETLRAILKEEPPPLSQVKDVPPVMERVVNHALEKNPADRFQSAHDIVFDLEAIAPHRSSVADSAGSATTLALRRSSMGGLLLVATCVFFATKLTQRRSEPKYHRLTFRRGTVTNARFVPDGQTIVYAAMWEGNANRLFATRFDSAESRDLNLAVADLLAVSVKGDLAIQEPLGPEGVSSLTVATVPFTGGVPRDVERFAISADWSPDGTQLALIRSVEGEFVLEYPRGKVLYRHPSRSGVGWLDNVRISPDGTHIALVELVAQGPSGNVIILNPDGTKVAESALYGRPGGLAWGPSGREIWFTAIDDAQQTLYAMNLSGATRVVWIIPGSLRLHDISREGRVLLARDDFTIDLVALPPGKQTERSLSWYGWSLLGDIAKDGQSVLFIEAGATGNDWGEYPQDGWIARRTYRRRGVRQILSRWKLGGDFRTRTEYLVASPLGAGAPRVISIPKVDNLSLFSWLPDGRLVFTGGRARPQIPNLRSTDEWRPCCPNHARKELLGGSRLLMVSTCLAVLAVGNCTRLQADSLSN